MDKLTLIWLWGIIPAFVFFSVATISTPGVTIFTRLAMAFGWPIVLTSILWKSIT